MLIYSLVLIILLYLISNYSLSTIRSVVSNYYIILYLYIIIIYNEGNFAQNQFYALRHNDFKVFNCPLQIFSATTYRQHQSAQDIPTSIFSSLRPIQKLLRLTCELTRSFTIIILEERILYFDNFVPMALLIHWSIRPQNLRLTFSQTLMLQTVLVYRFKRLDFVHGLSTISWID